MSRILTSNRPLLNESDAWYKSDVSTETLAAFALLVDQGGYEYWCNGNCGCGGTHHAESIISSSPPEGCKAFYDRLWTENRDELRWSAASVLAFYEVTSESLELRIDLKKETLV